MYENVEKVLNDFGKRLVEGYRDKLDSGNINASYDLYNSVRYMVEIGENSFEVKLELEDYWKYIENGRKAGKFPPIDKIKKWIEVKPILPRPYNGKLPTTAQLAYLISRKISIEGIEPKPILEQTIEEILSEFYISIENAFEQDIKEIFLLEFESFPNIK